MESGTAVASPGPREEKEAVSSRAVQVLLASVIAAIWRDSSIAY